MREPLKETAGHLHKGGRPTDAPQADAPAVPAEPASRRSNFWARSWRPAWDGVDPGNPSSRDHLPAMLPTFTFHEGRHTQSTWLIEDGIAEVARRARLGQKMKGMARVYDHVTPVMLSQITAALEARWAGSVAALTATERATLGEWFPHLRTAYAPLRLIDASRPIAFSSPFTK